VSADELLDFLSSYFGDGSTEEGVAEVVFVTADHPEYHRTYLGVLDRAIAGADDPAVARAIRDSFAASADDPAQARSYLESVRAEYLRQFAAATGSADGEPVG
jgi:hypothetical protein